MKKVAVLLCSFIMLANSFAVFAEIEDNSSEGIEVVEIHVSPDGEDSNNGTKERPLKTLEGAKTKANSVKDEKKQVQVIFHGGEYRINKTVTFGSGDSGFDNNPIIYRAADGEKPVFKGSVLLDASKFTAIEDEAIYNILPENAAPEIAQLDLKTQGISGIGDLPNINYGANVASYNSLFLDGEEQTLSRWPNTGYAIMGKVIDAGNGIFEVSESNPSRWGHSPNMRLHGFTGWDWSYERTKIESVDPEKRQIKINVAPIYRKKIFITNGRYFVTNIIEELDEPGEWYIDQQNLILYYYPIYPVKEAELELSMLTGAILQFDSARNIMFSGFGFEQTRDNAVCMKYSENITLTNNTYKNIGRNGISNFDTGTYNIGITNKNIEISNSTFFNIGASGVALEGGNADTLEVADIFIRNNHFSRCGQLKRSYQGGVNVDGVGITIENNVFEDMPHMAIGCDGALHQINYNEIFNVCQDSNDMGAIYTGRNATWRGTEVKFNYIHDLVPDSRLAGFIQGVYWDDDMAGQIMKYNIFENIPTGIFTNGGNDHYSESNIFIDCPAAVQHSYGGTTNTPNQQLYIDAVAKAEAFPIYYEKFPDMKNIDINYTKSHNNKVLNNYMVNSYGNAVDGSDPEKWSGKDLSRQNLSQGNVVVANDYSAFDPENGNYEIKPDAKILETLPELAKIKMADIGIQEDLKDDSETDDFYKIFPKNGQKNVSTSEFYLKWQPSKDYTKYHVEVAEDAEFNNIIFETDTIRTYAFCDKIKAGGKIYYWRVTGISNAQTRDIKEKLAYGTSHSFRTTNREPLDQIILTETIAVAESLYASVTPGTKSGQCDQEYITWYKEIIDRAKQMNSETFGDQGAVDALNTELKEATLKMASYIYKGYASIDKWITDADNWQFTNDKSEISDGIININGGHAFYGGELIKTFNVYKFMVKLENFSHMFVITYKTQGAGDPWNPSSTNHSFYIKNDIIEFQRYKAGDGGIIEVKPNDGLLKEGEWGEVAIGAMDVPGGIQVYMTLNGKEIFNYFDDTGLITADGYIQLSTYGAVTAQVKAVEELGEFDQSIVMGGNVAYDVPVDFDKSLLTKENISASNGSVMGDGALITMKATGDNSCFALNKIVEDNLIYNFDAMLDTTGDGQSIAVLGTGAGDEYRINFKENSIELIRYYDKKVQPLFISDKQLLKNGTYSNVEIGTCENKYGTRVFMYIDGQLVFDATDMCNKLKSGGLRFYDNNKKGLTIK